MKGFIILSSFIIFISTMIALTLCQDVNVLVCTEALCPDSKEFILTELDPTYALLKNYFNLTFIPYGNADIDKENHTVTCQHGDAECSANSFEQCAIEIYPNPDLYLRYVSCLATYQNDALEVNWPFEACAEKSSLSWQLIESCHDDPTMSWQLQVKADLATPDYHTYVPWVEVNGKVVNWFNDESLGKAICDEYPESNQPAVCKCFAGPDFGTNTRCAVMR